MREQAGADRSLQFNVQTHGISIPIAHSVGLKSAHHMCN